MSKDTAPIKTQKQSDARQDRLKAALKANMAKRKAQMRARKVPQTGETSQSEANEESS